MIENIKWLIWRTAYCLLLAGAYWWKSGTFVMVLFWIVTSYLLLNIVYLLYNFDKKKFVISYNYAVNSIMDIVPAIAAIATISYNSLFLSVVMGVLYSKFFIKSCIKLQNKDYI